MYCIKCGVKLAGSIVCGIYLQFKTVVSVFRHALYVGQKLTGDPLSAEGFIHNHGIQMEDISCFLYRVFDVPDGKPDKSCDLFLCFRKQDALLLCKCGEFLQGENSAHRLINIRAQTDMQILHLHKKCICSVVVALSCGANGDFFHHISHFCRIFPRRWQAPA